MADPSPRRSPDALDFDVPVLIIGGGPVGLAVAAEFGWRGIRCLMVEQTDGAIEHPKINGINMRTLEFCRRWGIAQRVHDEGFPKDYPHDHIYVTSLTGYLLARQVRPPMAEMKAPRGAIETFQRCPQTTFDPILKGVATSFPTVDLRYHVRCEGVEQDAAGVTAELCELETGTKSRIRANYAVACQGANSSVRDALGFKMEGTAVLAYSTNMLFRSAELLKLHDKGPGRSYIAIGPEGNWASINSINGNDLWRLQVSGSNDPKSWQEVDFDDCVKRFAGRDFSYELISTLSWIRRQLICDHYQSGRIFLAGDAVHQLTPAGSFGMNTGIGDAVDIAWKIAAMIDGWGGPGLLESYEAERRPIGKRNVDEAAARFKRYGPFKPGPAILEDTPEGARVRSQVASKLETTMLPFGEGFQVGYRYDASPIIWPDGTPTPPADGATYHPTTRPGARAPDAWIDQDTRMLDLYGKGFVLVRLGNDAPAADGLEAAAEACGVPFEVVTMEDPDIIDLYQRKLVLVRPDGHVAWRGDEVPGDCRAVIDRARGA